MTARIQDGRINSAEDFWQLIQDFGYLMDGENRADEREQLAWLKQYLDRWFADHPEIKIDSGSLDHFAMHAVWRLIEALTVNDLNRRELWFLDTKQRLDHSSWPEHIRKNIRSTSTGELLDRALNRNRTNSPD
jgi:hypothetical protein